MRTRDKGVPTMRTRDKVVLAVLVVVCSFWAALLIHLVNQLAHWAFA